MREMKYISKLYKLSKLEAVVRSVASHFGQEKRVTSYTKDLNSTLFRHFLEDLSQ